MPGDGPEAAPDQPLHTLNGLIPGGEALLSFYIEMELLSLRVSEFSMVNGDRWQFLSFGDC